jgi:hypothetical protein
MRGPGNLTDQPAQAAASPVLPPCRASGTCIVSLIDNWKGNEGKDESGGGKRKTY